MRKKRSRRSFHEQKNTSKKRIGRTDAVALAAFFCLAGMLIVSAYTSWVPDDKFFYYTIPQRLANGDRLIRDEWVLVQLTALFQYLPYRIYTLPPGEAKGSFFLCGIPLSLPISRFTGIFT